jgi:fucose permease
LLLVPACGALAFASGWVVFPIFFVYGLGLGIAITSINRLQSQRCEETRISEMNRLNLIWALGAFSCPWLANEIVRLSSVRTLFLALAGAFAAFTAWVVLMEKDPTGSPEVRPSVAHGLVSRLPALLAVTTLMATGLESSAGAWIATYANRLRSGFETPVAAATVFWLGLLAVLALHSMKQVSNFSEPGLLRVSTMVAAVGCVMLLAAQSQTALLIAAFLIGLGVGPVYPLLLSAVLPRVSGNAIFVVAGLGGTVFPWLTGVLSTHAGSLRIGMIVPATAGMALLASAFGVAGSLAAIDQGRESR